MHRPPLTAALAASVLAAALVTLPAVANADTTTIQATTPSSTENQARAVASGGDEWLTQADLTTWSTGAFPESWFTTGPTTSSVGGLELPLGTAVGHARTGDATTDLTSLYSSDRAGREGLGLATADLVASGGARYSVFVDLGGSTDNTTPAVLTAVNGGATGVDGPWRSAVPIGDIAAGTDAALADFQAQIAATSPDAVITGYGASAASAAGTVVGILGDGTDSYFTPEPTGTIVLPGTVTPSTLRAAGIDITATGFIPGEEVSAFLLLPNLEVVPDRNVFTAGADGAVSGTAEFQSSLPASEYRLFVEGLDSGVAVVFALTVSPDAVTTPPVAPPVATPAPTPGRAPVAVPVAGPAAFTG